MSKNETSIADKLTEAGLIIDISVSSRSMPVNDWPWKTSRSKGSPKCDIFIPEGEIYIEIKGLMTIYAMAKMAWLCKRNFNYYIFQSTESEWNMDYCINPSSRKVKKNIEMQVIELVNFSKNKSSGTYGTSELSLRRLEDFIKDRVNEYRLWNGKWVC